MRILLLGEYSNVHATLAEGLRALGHEVVVASNGDGWKNYPRDIHLDRNSPSKLQAVRLLLQLLYSLPKLRGFDVVQLINPLFVEIRASLLPSLYKYLRKHNGKMFLGGFGMDWYWVHTCVEDRPLRYSDFNMGDELRTNADAMREKGYWIGTVRERLNKMIAEDCDGIIAGLYEYWVCYSRAFAPKTTFIPFPIKMPSPPPQLSFVPPVKLFIGIQRARSEYKGTDIMLRAAEAIVERYPDRVTLKKVEDVPFAEYQHTMDGCDAMLDQLYSYTPSMNSLLAMSKGIICIGGGEEENYGIIGERELRPIINVQPTYGSVYNGLEQLVLHPERIERLKRESVEYVRRHHDYIDVARQYEAFYLRNTR